MTTLYKLEFRGIRSYSPDKVQEIYFQHPLTVILGENGAGKTVRST